MIDKKRGSLLKIFNLLFLTKQYNLDITQNLNFLNFE